MSGHLAACAVTLVLWKRLSIDRYGSKWWISAASMRDALDCWPVRAISFALAAFFLIMPALLNGFPFVLDDTMDYVALTPVLYRSTFYSLFVNATDLQLSPWLPIGVQAIIITHLIWLWLRIFALARYVVLLPVVTLFLTLTSSVGFVTSYLMPDVFTSALLLSVGLILFGSAKLSKWEFRYVAVLIGLSVSVHLSHIPILAVTLAAAGLGLLLAREPIWALVRRLLPVALPAAAAAGLIFASHVVLFGIAKLSPSGPIYFLASLIGNGPAVAYLKEACPEANYRICAKVDELPMDSNSFLWGGMLYELGWFEGYRQEAETIVRETIRTRPLDIAEMGIASVLRALQAHAPAEDFRPLGWNMWRVEGALSKYGPETVERFRESAQVREELPKTLIKRLDDVVLPISLSVLLGLSLMTSRRLPELMGAVLTVMTGIVANVVICSVFSGVFDRYQTRVSWLIPFLAVLLALRLFGSTSAFRARFGLFKPREVLST